MVNLKDVYRIAVYCQYLCIPVNAGQWMLTKRWREKIQAFEMCCYRRLLESVGKTKHQMRQGYRKQGRINCCSENSQKRNPICWARHEKVLHWKSTKCSRGKICTKVGLWRTWLCDTKELTEIEIYSMMKINIIIIVETSWPFCLTSKFKKLFCHVI